MYSSLIKVNCITSLQKQYVALWKKLKIWLESPRSNNKALHSQNPLKKHQKKTPFPLNKKSEPEKPMGAEAEDATAVWSLMAGLCGFRGLLLFCIKGFGV